MKTQVFVDGQEGTTGLEIHARLARRNDVELLAIDPERRKDPAARRELLNACDVAFLCLPDDAAREAAALTSSPRTRLIDASTAHRTDPAWAYGLPELCPGQRSVLRAASRVSVPGCHASGFVLAVRPLVDSGVLPRDYPVTCFSLTGYSGGGKKMIASYEGPEGASATLKSPRLYALSLKHKHLPEMQAHTGLASPPVFVPVVDDFYKGMAVTVPLVPRLLGRKVRAEDVHQILAERYRDERFVRVMPFDRNGAPGGFLDAVACNGSNRLEMFVFGHDEQIAVVSRFDNLGKGASGAAVQSLNVMLGLDESVGLE